MTEVTLIDSRPMYSGWAAIVERYREGDVERFHVVRISRRNKRYPYAVFTTKEEAIDAMKRLSILQNT